VTTIDAAAARRANKPLTLAAIAAFLGAALAGCGTTTGLFAEAGGSTTAQDALATAPAAAVQATQVAIAPVIGAPEQIATQMQTALNASMQARQVSAVTGTNDAALYTLRGYVVAARENTGTKISYIWDVTDKAGQRVNRITGEQISKTGASRDPWSAVTPEVIKSISDKTAGSLATWIKTQTPPAAAAAVAQVQKTSAGANAAVGSATSAATQTAGQVTRTAANGLSTTGSISRSGGIRAVVPNVTGAPGDGSVSLTKALQQELSRNGVAMANASDAAYRVEGNVKIGQGANGKQPIQIDWSVKDRSGKRLGTVSQKNDIPQGSLDGSWGPTANAAAAAAAQGILKLMKENSGT